MSDKKAQHTPGPWHTFTETFDSGQEVAERMSISIARGLPVVHGVLAGRTAEQAIAAANRAGVDVDAGNIFVMMGNGPASEFNARLIAAAPDLLEACEEWIEVDGPSVSLDEQRRRWRGIMERMAAAVAMARGAK